MNFQNLFEMQGMLFLLMILGAFLRWRKMVTDEGKALMTDLVIHVTLPCSIIKSFMMEFNAQILNSCLVIFIVAFAVQFGSMFVSYFLYPRVGDTRKKVLQYATICSNAGILGNPIAEGIFGPLGLLYASIYLIPQRVFMWSAGLTYFTECPDKKTLVKKVATHPCIIAVVLGMALMVFQISLPGVLDTTVRTIANANTAVSMMLIGTILAGVKLNTLFTRLTAYYSFVRLVFVPFLVYLFCRIAGVDQLVMGVSVVLSGMPAASVTAILAAKYHADEVFATKCVVFSTLLSMITVPLWCIFLA